MLVIIGGRVYMYNKYRASVSPNVVYEIERCTLINPLYDHRDGKDVELFE